MTDTLVVNLFGGPGVSKSTNAALVFGKLKVMGVNAEMAHEYAKDLTWEERHQALGFQPYIAAKQTWRIHRLLGKVEVVITDSPILLSMVYQGEGWSKHLGEHCLEVFRSWNTLNINLWRDTNFHPYEETGRKQTLEEAKGLDWDIKNMLCAHEIPHIDITVSRGEITAERITERVLERWQPLCDCGCEESQWIPCECCLQKMRT